MAEFRDFLFPRDLERTASNIRNVLVTGSCLAQALCTDFAWRHPAIGFDYLLFNNVQEMPARLPRPVADYDLQYLQIPLRSVLSDRIVRYGDFCGELGPELRTAAMASLAAMLDAGLRASREHGLLTIVSTFVVPQRRVARALARNSGGEALCALVRELNALIQDTCDEIPNVYVADTDEIAASFGKGRFLDDWWHIYAHASVMPHNWAEGTQAPFHLNVATPQADSRFPIEAHAFYVLIWAQIEAIYRTVRQIDQVKLVVFDLDNTLWRGRIADHYGDGMEWPLADGWVEGLTEAVHHLRARGILTAIASRNDAHVVAARWARAMPRGLLGLDDFVLKRIDYGSKADNVAAIMADAGVTAASTVFVDDNPVERGEVEARFPLIRTIGDDPFHTRRVLLWAPETQIATLSQESARREGMIRQQLHREADRAAMPREAFLRSLRCAARVVAIDGPHHPCFARALELLNKTNQFNTTGRRWPGAALAGFLGEGGRLFAFTLADRFVDYGLVGVILVRSHDVVQYVMSCRVLGLDVETAVLCWIVQRLGSPGASFTASVARTGVNDVCQDVFLRSGFRSDGPDRFRFDWTDEPAPTGHLALAGDWPRDWPGEAAAWPEADTGDIAGFAGAGAMA